MLSIDNEGGQIHGGGVEFQKLKSYTPKYRELTVKTA